MKFPVEKKSTLCIYTEPASADKLAGASATAPASASAGLAAAAEAAGLRRDLEAARGALRRQEARCRVLVAALSARLREREAAARAERLLRDRQLAGVLRALTALEARLRQEQRLIRRQLAERDATIARQADEISILRATHPADEESSTDAAPERFRWPGEEPGGADDLPEHPTRASRPSHPSHPAAFSLHRSARVKAHRVAPVPAPTPGAAPAPAPRRESEATLLRFKLSGAPTPPEVDCGALDSDSGVFHGSDGSDSSLRSDEAAAGGAGCCADEEPDDDLPAPARDLSKHYAHNPVLECVSQILLRDRDDAASPLPLPPPPPPQGCVSAPGGRRRAPPPPALWPSIREERESLADDAEAEAAEAASSPPPPAPPSRSQHLQERACALLTRRLTVVSHPELEQVDDAAQSPPPPPPPAPASPTPPTPPPPSPPSSASPSARSGAGAPPAVPPKPPQLGALGRLKRRAPARAPGAAPHRQILSNGSLIKAAADRSTSSSSPSSATGVVAGGAPVASRARGVGPVAARVQRQMESRLPAAPSPGAAPAAAAAAAAIRVGSSVSSLITGAAGGSIVCELARDRQPDALHSHFEEFRLEDVDIGDGEDHERSSGDGAAPATPSSTASTPTGAADTTPTSTRDDASTYESFLEATGLSQKSLLTPSRLISNHRSVLKPKDVKLRSRAARASAAPALAAPDRPAPIVRYWVEPYL